MARAPALVIQVKVKLHARVAALVQDEQGAWTASLKSPPVDGKANAELIALVAAHHGVPKAAVAIKQGASGRVKLVVIQLPA
jgi:uncharacterized protein